MKCYNVSKHGKGESESDIIEEVIQKETDEVFLNECTSQLVTSKKNEPNGKVQPNKLWTNTQTELESKTIPGSKRKIKCTNCKNYTYI